MLRLKRVASKLTDAYRRWLLIESAEQPLSLVKELERVCERRKLRVNAAKKKTKIWFGKGKGVALLVENFSFVVCRTT